MFVFISNCRSVAAYRLAARTNQPGALRAELGEARGWAIRFQLQTRFQPESVMYLEDPARCLGGFHNSLTNYGIRNDYVQHNISALLAYAKILQD